MFPNFSPHRHPLFISPLPLSSALPSRQDRLPCSTVRTAVKFHSSKRKTYNSASSLSTQATLNHSNPAFYDDINPNNPFNDTESNSYDCEITGSNGSYHTVNINGHATDEEAISWNTSSVPSVFKESGTSSLYESRLTSAENAETEEVYVNGSSYPTEVLDWSSPQMDSGSSSTYGTVKQNPKNARRSKNDVQMRRVETNFVDTFRMSSPYINAYQGLIFVIHIPGALIDENMFASIMEDIALMRVVGIKLVLVLGPHGLINDRLEKENLKTEFIDGLRITDSKTLQIVKELSGSMRFEVECALAKGVTNMPSRKSISVVSGNFFSAQPVGIIEGQDFGYTGKVRRIDVNSIMKRLDEGDIIVLPNVASSPSGQQFNCKAEEVAAECAAQLNAEKLIFMGKGETLYDRRSGHTISNLSLKSACRYMKTQAGMLPDEFRLSLRYSINALERGVKRAHILNRYMNGVLLMEVFHRDGVGLMVSRDLYEGFRSAKLTDVNGVKAIIKPLEEKGILKPRSRTMLEKDIDKFVVIERDGMIIACLSLTVMQDDPTWAELGCVAVHQNYRKLGKGDAMLGFTERMAFEKGVRNLFVLSTQSFDWFQERGFEEVSIDDLPESRQQMYDRSRRSKIFYKVLQGSRAVKTNPIPAFLNNSRTRRNSSSTDSTANLTKMSDATRDIKSNRSIPTTTHSVHDETDVCRIIPNLLSWPTPISPAFVARVPGGITNVIFAARSSQAAPPCVIVRVYGGEDVFSKDMRATETLVYKELSDCGICPELLGVFANGRVEAYVPCSRSLELVEMTAGFVCDGVAERLAKLHNFQPSASLVRKDVESPPLVWGQLEDWIRQSEGMAYDEMKMDRCVKGVGKLKQKLTMFHDDIVYCHNDLLAGNILRDDDGSNPARVTLIDFEYAAYNYRSYDIAGFFAEAMGGTQDGTVRPHMFPSLLFRRRFCTTYLTHLNGINDGKMKGPDEQSVDALLHKVEWFELLTHLYWGFWGLVQSKQATIDFPYAQFASQRFDQFFVKYDQLCE